VIGVALVLFVALRRRLRGDTTYRVADAALSCPMIVVMAAVSIFWRPTSAGSSAFRSAIPL
jgi:hypothetical protein